MAILCSEKNNCKLIIDIISVENDMLLCEVSIENRIFSLDFKNNKKNENFSKKY